MTFDIFYSEAKEMWGIRELVGGNVQRITFHRDLFFLIDVFIGLGISFKVGYAVGAWSCQFGKCRCYRA